MSWLYRKKESESISRTIYTSDDDSSTRSVVSVTSAGNKMQLPVNRQEAQAAAMKHLHSRVLKKPSIQAAFADWEIETPTDMIRLSSNDLSRPFRVQGDEATNKTLSIGAQNRILDCIRWFQQQEDPSLQAWLELDDEKLDDCFALSHSDLKGADNVKETGNNKSHSSCRKPLGSDLLTLNIGGEQVIQTLRSTFTFAAGSKLAEMFSGRWDETLPKNEHGHYFIDWKPEFFVPLYNFLRSLSAMTMTLPSNDKVLPITPSFADFSQELDFHHMVDSYDLTNVFYNYEINEHGENFLTFNNHFLLSRNCSIFDCPLENNPPRASRCFFLDIPITNGKQCHARQVQAFEMTFDCLSHCLVGWMRRGRVFTNDRKTFFARTSRIFFQTTISCLRYYDKDGDNHTCQSVSNKVGPKSVLRCNKNRVTMELEWYIDGILVAATNRSLSVGDEQMIDNVFRLGWSVPEDCELIPYIQVNTGSCRFSALELEP
jgi:hypothetical protein